MNFNWKVSLSTHFQFFDAENACYSKNINKSESIDVYKNEILGFELI
jgi:hypothetical protein